MTDEERQRQLDFILDQQARLAVDLRRWREADEERWRKADERWGRTEGGIRALLAVAETHEREIMEQGKQLAEQSRQIAAQGEQIAATREAGRETDERLNALINTVERLISERRDGGSRQA